MKIFTYAFNRPKYLEYQSKCLRKFIVEPFDFYCIDNAIDKHNTIQFKTICANNSIYYLKNTEPNHSLAGTSHYSALQWSYNNHIVNTEEIIVMLDHDTFPIEQVSINGLLEDAFFAGAPQSRRDKNNVEIEYFHPSLMIFNTKNMPHKHSVNFNRAQINGAATDIGGSLYYYFKANPDVKKIRLRAGHMAQDNPFLTKELIETYGYPHVFESIEGKFLHTRNGSNWSAFEEKIFEDRDKLIFALLDNALQKA